MSGSNFSPIRREPQRRPRSSDDDTDYQHRNFLNLVVAITLLTLAIAIVWAVKAMEKQAALDRCLASGRRDCVQIDAPPRRTIRTPDR